MGVGTRRAMSSPPALHLVSQILKCDDMKSGITKYGVSTTIMRDLQSASAAQRASAVRADARTWGRDWLAGTPMTHCIIVL